MPKTKLRHKKPNCTRSLVIFDEVGRDVQTVAETYDPALIAQVLRLLQLRETVEDVAAGAG